MSDPIADMLTRIRNAVAMKKEFVEFPSSKMKSSVLSVITVFELHKAANAIISDTFKFLEMLFAQAVLYVVFVVLMTQLSIYLEKRIGTRLQIKNFSQR